jgi:hypothetical protein
VTMRPSLSNRSGLKTSPLERSWNFGCSAFSEEGIVHSPGPNALAAPASPMVEERIVYFHRGLDEVTRRAETLPATERTSTR